MTNSFRFLFRLLIFILAICLFLERPAHAYLDPGTGSFLFQLVIGALFSALFSIRLFWANIKGFFARLGRKKPCDDSHDKP